MQIKKPLIFFTILNNLEGMQMKVAEREKGIVMMTMTAMDHLCVEIKTVSSRKFNKFT